MTEHVFLLFMFACDNIRIVNQQFTWTQTCMFVFARKLCTQTQLFRLKVESAALYNALFAGFT